MALELLGFQWLLLSLLSFYKVCSISNTDMEEMLNDALFDCSLAIKATNWSMECDSNNFDFASSSKYFAAKLLGNLSNDKPLIFEDLLHSTSGKDSQFYMCDSEWRYFILQDDSMLSTNCIKMKNPKKVINYLNESSLIKIEVSHCKEPQFTLNIVDKCFRLKDVLLYDNTIPKMKFLPIYSNNTVRILNLNRNSIQVIAEGLFAELNNLESLDLSHNLLKYVNGSLFQGIARIKYLELSHNTIEFISEDALNTLSTLEYISLSNNKLQNINENIFKFNSILSTVDISSNDFKKLPSTLFHPMQNLKNVSCANCSLSNLDKGIFQNSSNLAWIIFKQNTIQYLNPNMFKHLRFLEVLDLSDNNISYFNDCLFSNHPDLRYVNMSRNIITDLNINVFRGARNVRYLDLSANRITSELTDDYIKNFTALEYFALHHNRIPAVELGIAGPVRIRKIDISHNLIRKLNVKWKQFVYIEIFTFNNNYLTSIDLPPCIPNVKQTLTFSFQYNKISKINTNALIFDENQVKTDRSMQCFVNGQARNFVDLTNNPLLCDCKMYPFYKYIREKSPRRYQIEIFIDKGNITCNKPDFLKGNALISLHDDMLSCPLSDKCPKSCYCGIRGNDNSISVNCSSRALQEVPNIHPEGTTVLYFNRNQLKSMKSLNNHTWCNLTELHLDYNLISNLDNWEFPSTLRYLSVKGNKLKTLPQTLMQFISNQTNFQLYFGNNDFNCDCERKSFKNFLRENIDFVKDNNDILCNLTNNNTLELLTLTSVFDSVLCSEDIRSSNQTRLVIILCVCFSVLIILLLIYYRQHQLILSYFYVHCRGLYDLVYADAVDDDAIFDAFVAYSSNDREYMLQLMEELENNPPFFQLCIHERNWLPGRFITDNIADSVENSRRTIIILSSTFITSPWFNVELRAAVCKMTQDAMNRIVIILTDETISFDSIDPELRCVVSKRTYLKWGERWFWEKLRYALPRKSVKETKLNNRLGGSFSEVALIPYTNKEENTKD